ncbi:hypothetical protein Patl1_15823 [Pistacia atlantica]|uniref:Uncharacterized protein n=1 Tax=Pistacia atlantica TaxID=434234 RepID=A0ACC1BAB3_9ROSI|nr:hypothetical protein Patl1_15823 [Pistacia atlantica]
MARSLFLSLNKSISTVISSPATSVNSFPSAHRLTSYLSALNPTKPTSPTFPLLPTPPSTLCTRLHYRCNVLF